MLCRWVNRSTTGPMRYSSQMPVKKLEAIRAFLLLYPPRGPGP